MHSSDTGYKIGKASKLTGISTDKLRIWERRYAAVIPVRSQTGGRLYSYEDVMRLKLIKSLVDGGDSISNVARLTLEELQARVSEENQVLTQGSTDKTFRVAVVGESISVLMTSSDEPTEDLEIAACYKHADLLANDVDSPRVDVLIFEQPTLHKDAWRQISPFMDSLHAYHTVVVYRFAAQATLDSLPKSRCSSLRAPVSFASIRNHLNALNRSQPTYQSLHDTDSPNSTAIAPARRYDDETLAKIAGMSPTIKCECPHHLAELLTSLAAFEKYSRECENLSTEDSELHAYLSHTASHARYMIENALDKVIESENIQI